jgi:hypothetical protein
MFISTGYRCVKDGPSEKRVYSLDSFVSTKKTSLEHTGFETVSLIKNRIRIELQSLRVQMPDKFNIELEKNGNKTYDNGTYSLR